MVMAAVHPRTLLVQRADRELESFLTTLMIEKGLTEAEMLSIFARQLGNLSRFAIREERHPNEPQKIGDEA